MKKDNTLFYLSLLVSLIFILSYLIIAWFNRFTKDDFIFLEMARDNLILENVRYFYFNWEGPLGGLIIWFTSLPFFEHFQTPYIVNVISLNLIIIGIAVFYKSLFKTNAILSLTFSGFIAMDMYYNGLAISEVWFWMNGNFVYLALFGVILLGIGLLLSNKYYWFGVFIFLFAGSMRLNFSAILLFSFGLIFIYKVINNEKLTWRFYLPFFLLLAGTLIYIVAPGNYIRKSHFEISYAISDIFIAVSKMSIDYLYDYVLVKFPYHLVFLFPISFLLHLRQDEYPRIKSLLSAKNIAYLIVFAIFVLLVQNFVLYMAKGSNTLRTLTMVSFVFSSTLAIILTYFLSIVHKRISIRFAYIALFFAAMLLIRRTHINYPIVKNYSEAVDERTHLILDYKENYSSNPIDTLLLDPLPPSGWLHSSEITSIESTSDWINEGIEDYYKLPFKIFKKKELDKYK